MRRAVVRFAAVLLGGLCLTGQAGGVAGPTASADSVADRGQTLSQQIVRLRDELEGTSKAFVDAAVMLERSRARLAVVQAQLTAATAALAAAKARDERITSQLAFARAEQVKGERALAGQRQAEVRTRDELGLIAREAYVHAGNPVLVGLSVALQADNADQFADRLALARTAMQSQDGAIERLSTLAADLRAHTAKLAAVKAQVAQLKLESAAAVSARSAARAMLRTARDQQARLVMKQRAALAVIKARADDERASLERMVAEQNRLQAALAARARAEAARLGFALGVLPPPVPGLIGFPSTAPITSYFGPRQHPILHLLRLHTGIDFGMDCGTPVHAVASGSVIDAGWAGGYGNRVIVDHGWLAGAAMVTSYNHLSRIMVRSGQVTKGQLIGYSGTTGLSTGCHLHFETLVNGMYVDPMRYL